jgi:hypothetical protein
VLVDARPLALDQGDFVVLPHGDARLLLHAPDAPATSFTDLLPERGAELWRPGATRPYFASATPRAFPAIEVWSALRLGRPSEPQPTLKSASTKTFA